MITKICFLPELAKERGLLGGTLDRLRKVVILAGPNGSGKSRYLQLVQEICTRPFRGVSNTNDYQLHQLTREAFLGSTFSPDVGSNPPFVESANIIRLETTGRAPVLVHLSYPAKNVQIINSRAVSPPGLKQVAETTSQVGFDNAYAGIDAYCTQIARRMFHAEHPRLMNMVEVRRQKQDTILFNRILQTLLGGEIHFTLDGTEILPTFRERPLLVDELSTGERILFAWAISLHQQRQGLSSAIILIDEPESHLHHDACIRALSKLRDEILGHEGQIWLATHSVPLLAWGGLDSVHFVKNGAIEFAGNKVTSVVESLLGGKDGRDRLKTFIADAEEIAFMEFAAQCVLPAGVADPKTGDRQETQFIEVIRQRIMSQQLIRILDFSAGKGRFGSALREHLATYADASVKPRIEYHAYNVPDIRDSTVEEDCKERIAALEQPGSVDNYYWGNLPQLQARHGPTFDLVILCNVLHEIKPEEWLAVFRDIHEVLAPDGVLLVMEDLILPVGELPNERGYLLLDDFGLGRLFGDPKRIKLLQKRDNRLLAVEIPKSLVSRVTPETRASALRHIRDHARVEINRIRSKATAAPSHRLGREHAHYSMLFTNASLALEAFNMTSRVAD